MRRVAVFSLGGIGNFGDEIIGDTTSWLIRSLRPDLEPVSVQLQPFARHYPVSQLPDYVLGRLYWAVTRRVLRHCPLSVRFPFERLAWRMRNGRYFRSHLRGTSAAVYAMGMIKYCNQGFCYLAAMVNEEATRLGIPVMMSAASVARADPSDLRCRQLRAALHEPSVRAISTRDGEPGVERLRRDYGLDLAEVSPVGDPALWIPECYGIRRDPSACGPVGVNLARRGLFATYGSGADDASLVAFYGALGRELDRRGLDWVLFSNGMDQDERFGRDLLAAHGWPAEKLLPRAKDVRGFIRRVGSFRAVFGLRLHSCLTAWALGVPVAGIVWEDKIACVAASLGASRHFIPARSLSASEAADNLLRAMSEPIDRMKLDQLRAATRAALVRFLDAAPGDASGGGMSQEGKMG